ncbi:MAG: response regulator [Deltaproteobacteria bacterium]|nr:response regulator [Deltaproteobacteria bacterium]
MDFLPVGTAAMGVTILVIDDDKHTRRILESLFRTDPEISGLVDKVVSAGDGEEGLQLFEAEHPALVVTDLLMPRKDGFAVCRAIRARPDGKETALVAISAVYKDLAVVQRLKTEFGAVFFQKPFQVRDLVKAVKGVAQRRAGSEAPAAPRHVTAPRVAAVKADEEVKGELARRPLAGILFDLLESQATGALVLRRDRVRKDIFLVMGHPVGAESNVRQETLGHYLVARRVIDEEQQQEALALSKKDGVKLGQALVKLQLMKDEDVIRHLAALVRLKIVSSLRWTNGDYHFAAGDTFSERLPKATLEPVALILQGLKRTAHDDEIAKQLSLKVDLHVTLTPRAARYRDEFGKVFGALALAALAGRPRVGDLLRRGKDAVQLFAGVDALLQTAMAEMEEAPALKSGAPAATGRRGATAAFAVITEAVPQADPLALSNLVEPTLPGGAPAGLRADPPAAAAAATALYEELFGEDRSQVAPAPQAPGSPAARDDGAVPQPMEIAESGVIEILPPPEKIRSARAPVPTPDPRVAPARALILRTYLGIHDKNFYQVLGVSPEATQDEIAAAYGAAVKKFRLAEFEGLDLGRDYARLEELHVIFRRAYEILFEPLKRLDYDRRIGIGGTVPETPGAITDTKPDPLTAELRFQQGVRELQAEHYAKAAEDFAAAARLAPDAADYHAHAAFALHRAAGASAREAVSAHLAQAFAIDADLASGHEFAGRICFELGDDEGALPHLERTLDADPRRLEAFAALEQILTRHKEWRRLERQYRKLIHRVGDGDPDLQLRLWWNLAEIYRTRIGDLESARVAFEIASRLAPDEPALHQALAEVTAPRPDLWRETARALRAWWRLRPDDPTPGRALFALHHRAGRADAALVAAMALACRGDDGSPAAVEYLHSYRPRFLGRIPSLDPALWQRLRHPDDDPQLGELFALINPVVRQLHSFGLKDLDVTELDRVLPAEVPETFGRILDYVCGLFGVPAPAIYLRADFGAEAHVGGTEPPVLLCGPQALGETDKVVLAYRLGRAATYLLPGRATGGALPSRTLKTFLLGAMTLSTTGLAVEDPDGTIGALRELLGAMPAEAQARLRELVAQLSREKTSLNLSSWSRALGWSADRAGLLVCNDLPTAVRLVAQTQARGAEDALIDFALGDDYLEAREALGLAVAL